MAPNDKQWACEQIETQLSDYLDRLLTAAERGGFEEHVAGCARCAPLVRSVGGLVNGMHRLEPLEAPPRLVYNILDRTLGARTEKKGWRAWMGWLQPIWQPRFAYGAVSVLVTAAVLFQALGFQWRKPTLADLSPVNMYRAADRRAHIIYARGTRSNRSRRPSRSPVPAGRMGRSQKRPASSTGPTISTGHRQC